MGRERHIVHRQPAVCLVRQDVRADGIRDRIDARALRRRHRRTRRIMRRVDDDHPRPLVHEPFQFVKIVAVAVLFAQFEARDRAANRFRDGVELLICRIDGDDVVARLKERVEE